MSQKDKELLLELLKRVDEEGLLNIYDSQGNYYEVDWIVWWLLEGNISS